MLFALYADQDQLSYDGLRNRSSRGIDALNRHLTKPLTPKYRATPLAVFLFGLAVLYFGSGVAKVVLGGPEWVSATNLGRYIEHFYQLGYSPFVRDLVLQFDTLLLIAAIGTIVFELGFVFSVLFDRLFHLFVLLAISFHIGIAIVMGPVFLYSLVFLALFVDWEKILERLGPSNRSRSNTTTLTEGV
ncbi:HTTM domain-containing protein [Natronosalvus vescus]|uniref:HTTM domain-containing protein n=1 Tax=Natronosalvus vescus TaxID=2953881 RepID=UPI002091A8E2